MKNLAVKDMVAKKAIEENVAGYKAVPDKVLILGKDRYYSTDCYETQLNNNVVVVGTSGAGKTRSIVMPNLLQAQGSYVVSDPKGNLAKKLGPYLEKKGYKVVCMDFIHPETSLHYNPIGYCKTSQDVMRLAHTLVYEMSKGKGNFKDPFWDEMTLLCICALVAYMLETDEIEEDEKNIRTLLKLVKECNRKYRGYGERSRSDMDNRMDEHRAYMECMGKESWACSMYDEFNSSPDKTHATINATTVARLATFDTLELRQMIRNNDIDFTELGRKPMALFVQVSDTDRSMDILANLFYTQLMNELCTYADDCCEDSRLPVPVQFILDDFATNARIDNFQNMIANIRSRGISAMIMVQSESQLYAGYGDDAQTIIDNCNTYVYMGGSNPKQAELVGLRANKLSTSILNMPIGKSWIFRRGQEPVLCDNFDLEWFMAVKGVNAKKTRSKNLKKNIPSDAEKEEA